jgi:hypothetical protein
MLRCELVTSARARPTRNLEAEPDRVDVRGCWYAPTLRPLPDILMNYDLVPEILDRGAEGACTGFDLAAVINFSLDQRRRKERVSPRIPYEMASRFNEWPGDGDEGSSAAGAMRRLARHSVCTRNDWPDALAKRLGMERLRTPGLEADQPPSALLHERVNRLPGLVSAAKKEGSERVCTESHGGLDKDPDTMNSCLHRILYGTPNRSSQRATYTTKRR